MRIHSIYLGDCPNCGGVIDDYRLMMGLACSRCIPNANGSFTPTQLLEELKKNGKLDKLKVMYEAYKFVEEFKKFFEKALGSKPWSAQVTWARRVALKRSFSIIAPTGVGKTVFGLVMSLYIARRGGKAYIILPTTPLVVQAEERLREFASRVGVDDSCIIAMHSRLSRSERRERLEAIENGDFKILVTTSRFMIQHADTLSKHKYRFVFADDVDAVLKSGRSITALLRVIGFREEDLEEAQKAIVLRRRIAVLSEKSSSREEFIRVARELESIQRRLEKRRRELNLSLVVSSATGRPRGPKVLLFRELLGFQAGSRAEFLRRIVDTYIKPSDSIENEVVNIVKMLGKGGLVYVPVDKGVEYAEHLAEILRENGVKAEAFHSKNQRALDRFIEGETDVLVGVAVYYGVLVRGLDLPWLVRYAVFAGVPRFKFSVRFENPHPVNVLRMLSILVDIAPQDVAEDVRRYYISVRRVIRRLSPASLQMIAKKMQEGGEPESVVEELFYRAAEFVRRLLSRKEIIERLRYSREVVLKEEEGQLYIYIPDLMTYLQASGRTSRLYAGGLTKGLSIVVVDEDRLLEGIVTRMRWFIEDSRWRDFKELLETGELKEIVEEIDTDREKVLKAMRGELAGEVKDLVKTVLMIVESPNKARTIAGFFGRPSIRLVGEGLRAYEVTTGNLMLIIAASGGHVRELTTEDDEKIMREIGKLYGAKLSRYGILVDEDKKVFIPVYTSIKRCLVCNHQFTEETSKCPRCGSSLILDSRRTVEALRELAMEVDKILIATDPDTEGEKIGWDIAALLRPFTTNVSRIEFHEVTRKAIMKALAEERLLSESLVEAQLVRRIEDRWIGFALSQVLWWYFWPEYCMKYEENKDRCKEENRNLSAGRVQTPVLGWIINRYKEYMDSKTKRYILTLAKDSKTYTVSFLAEEVGDLKRTGPGEIRVEVKTVEIVDEEVKAPPPYTTDTMLTEASRVLKLGAPEIMRLAQDLFEMGLITYHRTDSTRVSDTGIRIARDYLRGAFGDEGEKLFHPRKWGEGGAHEAIRPTRPVDSDTLYKLVSEGELELPRPLTRMHYRLYDLIFRRFIASQMRNAVVKKQIVEFKVNGKRIVRERIIDVVEPSFLLIYKPIVFEEAIEDGVYRVVSLESKVHYKVTLYTQGDVVKLMKEKGIGRPSTYATIIDKLLKRRYVLEERKRRKLIPTRLGREVFSFLNKEFGSMVSEERTRELESKMDMVSEGAKDYIEVLNELYKELKPIISKYIENREYKIPT